MPILANLCLKTLSWGYQNGHERFVWIETDNMPFKQTKN